MEQVLPRAALAIAFRASVSDTAIRIALASAAGSECGTTMPAPPLSSSTACGNAVAITGRPAAIASTSTPDVT